MFDTIRIGRRIAKLRKDSNMTQMELADRMNVSFQAVSNWERGNSMPDISKLPELAEIFNISIDGLIGEKNELLERVISDKDGEYLKNSDAAPEEVAKIAPILRPAQVDQILDREEEALHQIDFAKIRDLVPFFSTKRINGLVLDAAGRGAYRELQDFAPFASREILEEIADQMFLNEVNSDRIVDLAPFISSAKAAELAVKLYDKYELDGVEDLLPLICKETRLEIIEKEFARHGLKHFGDIAPLLGDGVVKYICRESMKKEKAEE